MQAGLGDEGSNGNEQDVQRSREPQAANTAGEEQYVPPHPVLPPQTTSPARETSTGAGLDDSSSEDDAAPLFALRRAPAAPQERTLPTQDVSASPHQRTGVGSEKVTSGGRSVEPTCVLCMGHGTRERPLLNHGGKHVHEDCAEWCPQAYWKDGRLVGLRAEIQRAMELECAHCKKRGAALGCSCEACPKSFHLMCVERSGGVLLRDEYLARCKEHAPQLVRDREKQRRIETETQDEEEAWRPDVENDESSTDEEGMSLAQLVRQNRAGAQRDPGRAQPQAEQARLSLAPPQKKQRTKQAIPPPRRPPAPRARPPSPTATMASPAAAVALTSRLPVGTALDAEPWYEVEDIDYGPAAALTILRQSMRAYARAAPRRSNGRARVPDFLAVFRRSMRHAAARGNEGAARRFAKPVLQFEDGPLLTEGQQREQKRRRDLRRQARQQERQGREDTRQQRRQQQQQQLLHAAAGGSSGAGALGFDIDTEVDVARGRYIAPRAGEADRSTVRQGVLDPILGTTCHFCRQKMTCGEPGCPRCEGGNANAECVGHSNCSRCSSALGTFCSRCLVVRFGLSLREARAADWVCPTCYEEEHPDDFWLCNCSFCMRRRGMKPLGLQIYNATKRGYRSVADHLQAQLVALRTKLEASDANGQTWNAAKVWKYIRRRANAQNVEVELPQPPRAGAAIVRPRAEPTEHNARAAPRIGDGGSGSASKSQRAPARNVASDSSQQTPGPSRAHARTVLQPIGQQVRGRRHATSPAMRTPAIGGPEKVRDGGAGSSARQPSTGPRRVQLIDSSDDDDESPARILRPPTRAGINHRVAASGEMSGNIGAGASREHGQMRVHTGTPSASAMPQGERVVGLARQGAIRLRTPGTAPRLQRRPRVVRTPQQQSARLSRILLRLADGGAGVDSGDEGSTRSASFGLGGAPRSRRLALGRTRRLGEGSAPLTPARGWAAAPASSRSRRKAPRPHKNTCMCTRCKCRRPLAQKAKRIHDDALADTESDASDDSDDLVTGAQTASDAIEDIDWDDGGFGDDLGGDGDNSAWHGDFGRGIGQQPSVSPGSTTEAMAARTQNPDASNRSRSIQAGVALLPRPLPTDMESYFAIAKDLFSGRIPVVEPSGQSAEEAAECVQHAIADIDTSVDLVWRSYDYSEKSRELVSKIASAIAVSDAAGGAGFWQTVQAAAFASLDVVTTPEDKALVAERAWASCMYIAPLYHALADVRCSDGRTNGSVQRHCWPLVQRLLETSPAFQNPAFEGMRAAGGRMGAFVRLGHARERYASAVLKRVAGLARLWKGNGSVNVAVTAWSQLQRAASAAGGQDADVSSCCEGVPDFVMSALRCCPQSSGPSGLANLRPCACALQLVSSAIAPPGAGVQRSVRASSRFLQMLRAPSAGGHGRGARVGSLAELRHSVQLCAVLAASLPAAQWNTVMHCMINLVPFEHADRGGREVLLSGLLALARIVGTSAVLSRTQTDVNASMGAAKAVSGQINKALDKLTHEHDAHAALAKGDTDMPGGGLAATPFQTAAHGAVARWSLSSGGETITGDGQLPAWVIASRRRTKAREAALDAAEAASALKGALNAIAAALPRTAPVPESMPRDAAAYAAACASAAAGASLRALFVTSALGSLLSPPAHVGEGVSRPPEVSAAAARALAAALTLPQPPAAPEPQQSALLGGGGYDHEGESPDADPNDMDAMMEQACRRAERDKAMKEEYYAGLVESLHPFLQACRELAKAAKEHCSGPLDRAFRLAASASAQAARPGASPAARRQAADRLESTAAAVAALEWLMIRTGLRDWKDFIAAYGPRSHWAEPGLWEARQAPMRVLLSVLWRRADDAEASANLGPVERTAAPPPVPTDVAWELTAAWLAACVDPFVTVQRELAAVLSRTPPTSALFAGISDIGAEGGGSSWQAAPRALRVPDVSWRRESAAAVLKRVAERSRLMGNQGRSAARRALQGVPAAVMAGGKALAKSSLQLQDGAVYATVSLGVIAAAAAELGAPLHSGDGDAASGASVLVPLLDKALSMRGMLHAALVRLIQSTLANDLACMVQADVSSALTTVAGLDGWKGSAGLLRFVVGVVDAVLVALASSDAGSEAAGRARAEAGALARALASSGVPPDMLQFVAGCATVAWYKRAVVGANAKLCAAQAACAVFQFVRVCLAAAQEASPALDRSVPLLSPLLPFVVNALRGCPVEGVHVPHPHSLALDTAAFDFMASGEVQRTLGGMPEPVRFKFHNCMFAKSIAAISRACANHPQLAQGPVPDAQAGAGGLGDADELMAMSNAVLAATASILPNIGIRPMRPPPLYNEASRLAVATNKMAAGSDWGTLVPAADSANAGAAYQDQVRAVGAYLSACATRVDGTWLGEQLGGVFVGVRGMVSLSYALNNAGLLGAAGAPVAGQAAAGGGGGAGAAGVVGAGGGGAPNANAAADANAATGAAGVLHRARLVAVGMSSASYVAALRGDGFAASAAARATVAPKTSRWQRELLAV